MSAIDIEVSAELQEMFKLPTCESLRIPAPKPLKVALPGGGSLQSFSDLSKGIPSDCAMTFNLLLQIGPFLASIECLVKVLKFVHTLVEVLKDVTSPISLVSAIPKIIKAAEPVLGCALAFTPLGLIPFIRDLLCLILKVLNCFLGNMKSVIKILKTTTLQIQAATEEGNEELLASLNCAKENAMIQAKHLTSSLEVVGVILDLAGDFMQIAGIEPIKMPTIADNVDITKLEEFVTTVQGFASTLQIIVDTLGGCES